jgi:hypothetical protein
MVVWLGRVGFGLIDNKAKIYHRIWILTRQTMRTKVIGGEQIWRWGSRDYFINEPQDLNTGARAKLQNPRNKIISTEP